MLLIVQVNTVRCSQMIAFCPCRVSVMLYGQSGESKKSHQLTNANSFQFVV